MKNRLKVFFLFFALGLLVYGNSLNNKFLIDDYAFLENPVLSQTKFILSQWNPYREQALGVLDGRQGPGYYRPMAHMVLDFCYAVFKDNYWQYHLLNLSLFVLASWLAYLLVAKLTGNSQLAFLTGLFYLIHPINGIIVNYISAGVFAFQVVFTLGTILLLLASLEAKGNRALYFLSLLFSFLSLFWHESGAMVPFYVCAVILLFRKDPKGQKAAYLFPYFFIVFSYIVFRVLFMGGGNLLNRPALFHVTGWEYYASLFQVLAWYISKLFYPQGIVMQWTAPLLDGHIILNVLGLCLLLMLFLLLFIRFTREKICQLALAWCLIGFSPVCLAAFRTPENGVEIEPHWFVFSSLGFFILAAYFCLVLLGRMKKTGLAFLFIIIFAWGSVSHAYNQLWADQKTYTLYWLKQDPNSKPVYFYLADAYRKQGALKESAQYYRMALKGYSSDEDIYINLGMIDYMEGDLKGAESNYKLALKVNPRSSGVYNNLGAIYLKENQWGKADQFFRQALVYNPFLLESRMGLAVISLNHADYTKAIDLCLKNLDIVDDDPKTLQLLIDIFIRRKDFVDLDKFAHRFISSQSDPAVLTKLGVRMAQAGDPVLARDCFIKAIRVSPDYKDAYLAAGTFFANQDKLNEAIRIWELGSGIDPSDQRFKNSIAKARALLK